MRLWKLPVLILIPVLLVLTGCKKDDTEAESKVNAVNQPPSETELLGILTKPPILVETFAGPSTKNSEVNLADYRGKAILIFFGYTSCPDVCPTTFAEMRRMTDELGQDSDKVQIIFVSVDPERDTLDRMKVYAETFNEDFIGIRVEGEALQQLMDVFEVKAFKEEYPDSAAGYVMNHTGSLFLVDPEGRWVEKFLYGTAASTIIHDLRLILDL